MDWDKLRIFYKVAQVKSLTRAGEVLNSSQSAISRQISQLEESMGIALFHRHARGLILTEQGEILFRTVSDMKNKLQATQNLLADANERPKGPFKITAPHAIGNIWLTPVMKEFCQLYPDIDVELILDDKELDVSMREADVALRLFPSKHPDVIQKHIVTLTNSIYASTDYIQEFGTPDSLESLKHHRLLNYSNTESPPFAEANWLFKRYGKKYKYKPYFTTNSLTAMRTAVKNGMGIAAMPDYMMYRARHISKILSSVDAPTIETYFIYPLELKNSKRISVFKSFLRRKLQHYKF